MLTCKFAYSSGPFSSNLSVVSVVILNLGQIVFDYASAIYAISSVYISIIVLAGNQAMPGDTTMMATGKIGYEFMRVSTRKQGPDIRKGEYKIDKGKVLHVAAACWYQQGKRYNTSRRHCVRYTAVLGKSISASVNKFSGSKHITLPQTTACLTRLGSG